jgi:putative MATE family efflux protein
MSLDLSYKGLINVALPISLGSFVQFVVVLTDNAFLSRVGMNVMNGAGLSSLLYVSFFMIGIGLSSGAQIIIARRNGQERYKEAGAVFSNSIILSVLFAIGSVLVMEWMVSGGLDGLIRSDEVRYNMRQFLSLRAIGILAYFPALIIIGFYVGVAKTRVLIYATIITASINIALDWILIFGNLGAPEMGIRGAAWATIIAELASLIFLAAYFSLDPFVKKFKIKETLRSLPLKLTGKIMKISFPLMIQHVMSLSTWTVFFFLIEKLGDRELMSSQIIRFSYMLIFVGIMGISQTTKTYISGLIAEGKQPMLGLTMKRLVVVNIIGVIILSHGMWLYPDVIAGIFTDDPVIIDYTRKSMYIVIGAMFVACFSSVLLNTVEGAGRTQIGMLIEFAASSGYLFLTWLITIKYPQPIYYVWFNDYLYFGVIVILSYIYLKKSNWKYSNI